MVKEIALYGEKITGINKIVKINTPLLKTLSSKTTKLLIP
jgi:hypothetical protein